jgi:hypothetical protein
MTGKIAVPVKRTFSQLGYNATKHPETRLRGFLGDGKNAGETG